MFCGFIGICSLEKKKGPCRMTVPNVRFYFDNQRMKCMPFDYGGRQLRNTKNSRFVKNFNFI